MSSPFPRDCSSEKGDHLNRMDNPGFVKDTDVPSTVELGNIQKGSTSIDVSKSVNGNGIVGCSEMCLSLHKKYQNLNDNPPPPPEGPWHRLKTIFLIGTIVLLILWIIIYVITGLTSAT